MSAAATTLRAAGVAVAVVAADQFTKSLVRGSIGPLERIHVLPGVELIYVRNSGVAFSLFSGGGPFVAIIAVVALASLLAFFFTHLQRRLVWLPTGLLLGGAAGNLIDRVREGAVTDFVKLPHWPAFNVADISITLGVVSLIYVLERVK